MYSSAAPGSARRGGNPPVNVTPPQIRGAPNPSPMANADAVSSRISDVLDQVKAGYEAAIQQLKISKMEQVEMGRKIQSQVVEMDHIQQTVKMLEADHRRIRQQYEEDTMRMHRQLEGQSIASVKSSSNKRTRTQSISNSGAPMRQEDALVSVANVAAGAASSQSNSPVRVVPVQPASRSLQQLGQLGQQPIAQDRPRQSEHQSPQPPARLSPLEDQSTTRTNRPIPGLNRDAVQERNGQVERRSIRPISRTGPPSPPDSKKLKSNGNSESNSTSSHSNGKGALPSVSASTGSASYDALLPSAPNIRRKHHGSDESSPSSDNSSTQSHTAGALIPSASGFPVAGKRSTPGSNPVPASSSSSSSGSNATPKTSNPKASELKWRCVYSSKSAMSYQESERPVAEMHQSMDHQSVVCVVRFSNDGTLMASGSHRTAQVFDVKTGDRKFSAPRPGSSGGRGTNAADEADDAYVRAVCFSPDRSKLVAGMPNNTIRMWNIASNVEGPVLTGHESVTYSLDYMNDFIVSGSGDRTVRLWDARSGQCKKIFGNESGGPSDGVTSVALSPDGRLLAAGSLDTVVRIWDTETAQLLDRLEGHSDSVYSVAFSPGGKDLISGSFDKNIMLWDVSAQSRTRTRPRMVLQGHKDFVLSVAYTPDGRWFMSGSKDRSVVFWDPRSSRSVLTLSGYRNSVISVASSSASPYFATGSGDCCAVVWKYQCQTF